MDTEPANPDSPFTAMEKMEPGAPACWVTLAGEMEMLKSWTWTAGEGDEGDEPPQPASAQMVKQAELRHCR
jgi:hypothetical protein